MEFAAALIAGGRSRRFGSDKSRLAAGPDGEPLWLRQVRVLQELAPSQLLVSGRADQAFDLPDGVEWVPDEGDDLGPLEGIRRCLAACRGSHLLCLAVDLPWMTSGYLRGLLEACGEGFGVVPRLTTHWEPLAAVFPVEALVLAELQMAGGRLALQEFVGLLEQSGRARAMAVSAPDSRLFHNVNTPQDWG